MTFEAGGTVLYTYAIRGLKLHALVERHGHHTQGRPGGDGPIRPSHAVQETAVGARRSNLQGHTGDDKSVQRVIALCVQGQNASQVRAAIFASERCSAPFTLKCNNKSNGPFLSGSTENEFH